MCTHPPSRIQQRSYRKYWQLSDESRYILRRKSWLTAYLVVIKSQVGRSAYIARLPPDSVVSNFACLSPSHHILLTEGIVISFRSEIWQKLSYMELHHPTNEGHLHFKHTVSLSLWLRRRLLNYVYKRTRQ